MVLRDFSLLMFMIFNIFVHFSFTAQAKFAFPNYRCITTISVTTRSKILSFSRPTLLLSSISEFYLSLFLLENILKFRLKVNAFFMHWSFS